MAGGAITTTSGSSVFITGRTVTLAPFTMAKYETTYQLWKEVYDWARAHGYTFANPGLEGHGTTYGTGAVEAPNKQTRPVTLVSWRDAVVWCNAYSEMSGKTPVYTSSGSVIKDSTNATACDYAVMDMTQGGYRLPTEAEWEYAARGGDQGDAAWGYTYAGSNTLGDVAWYGYPFPDSSDPDYGAHPVGEKDPNRLGLFDMSGNVLEWCWDWHDTIAPGTLAEGPASGTMRIRRGGSLKNYPIACSVSYRFGGNDPAWSSYDNGFRVVCP